MEGGGDSEDMLKENVILFFEDHPLELLHRQHATFPLLNF